MKAETKEVAQRPHSWGYKLGMCQSGAKSEKQSQKRDESMVWLAPSYFGAQGCNPRRGEQIPPLHAYCTQCHKHYANDAEELKRYGFFKKSKANVTQRNVTNVNRSGEWFNMESRNLVPRNFVK